MNTEITFKNIGLLKENESPENPGALEQRVALTPEGVKSLVKFGANLFVEEGAGTGIGFSDQQYLDAGAIIQSAEDIYKHKNLLIKFKGPSLNSIALMDKGTTLFCMAHLHSFPIRKKLFEENKITVIAMEEVLESPKYIADEIIISKKAINDFFLSSKISLDQLKVHFIGLSSRMYGAIRRAGNRNTKSLKILHESITTDDLEVLHSLDENSLYVYDSKNFEDSQGILHFLKSKKVHLLDLTIYEDQCGKEVIKSYKDSHPSFHLGMRKIQCLHETGMAGARYGYKLLLEESKIVDLAKDAVVSVLGYGNVGMGAIDECYSQGSKIINVLTRKTTKQPIIELYLKNSHLIINGAEQPANLRGKNYLIKNEHLGTYISAGNVVIDLVGGSESNRSAVEPIINCSFLTDPFFIKDDVYFSSLWGWPMMGMMKESAVKYSSQIVDILIGNEKLIKGIDFTSDGVKRAVVCQ